MRRENNRRLKNSISSDKTVYIIGIILLLSITAFVVTFVVYSNKLNDELYSFDSDYLAQYNSNNDTNVETEDDLTSASSSIGKSIEEAEGNKVETKETPIADNNSGKENKQISKAIENNKKAESKVEKDPIFISPIEGDILKEFAQDNLIYSETLKEWTTHLGIDIKAEKASIVKAASDGIVKYIKNDPRYGLTIIIEHSNGFQSLYANLLTTEFVAEGEKVKSGQTIGTVGDSSVYEIVDETHLHFEILKDGENLNPMDYIK